MHRAEMLVLAIIDCRAFDLIGGNKPIRLVDRGSTGGRDSVGSRGMGIHSVLRQEMVMKRMARLSPTAITPITPTAEEQKEDNDNENKGHIFLQNM